MPVKPRKTRSDSVAGLTQAFADANKPVPLTWPESIDLPSNQSERAEALKCFEEVQRARSSKFFKPHHSILIAEYAIVTGQIRVLMEMLRRSGAVINSNGRPTRSPVLDAMSVLYSIRSQLMKQLNLTGRYLEDDSAAASANRASQVMMGHDDNDMLGGIGDMNHLL